MPRKQVGVVLDGFDTSICCPWSEIRSEVAHAIDIPAWLLHSAFQKTQEKRNTGCYPTSKDEMNALLTSMGVVARRSVRAVEIYESLVLQKAILYDDVGRFIESCAAAGVPISIVSNCGPLARVAFTIDSLNERVHRVMLSCEIGYRKPDPEVYQLAREGLPEVSDFIFVDDNPAFCAGAKEAGFEVIQITRNSRDARYERGAEFRQESSLDAVASIVHGLEFS